MKSEPITEPALVADGWLKSLAADERGMIRYLLDSERMEMRMGQWVLTTKHGWRIAEPKTMPQLRELVRAIRACD